MDPASLHETAGDQLDHAAQPAGVAAAELDDDHVTPWGVVAEDAKRLVQRAHDHVDVPVVVDVPEHGGSPRVRCPDDRAPVEDTDETRSHALEEQDRLPVVGVDLVLVGLGIDVPAGDPQILVPVTVEVEEARTPGEERPADRGQAVLAGPIVEQPATQVEVQGVGVAREIRGEQIGMGVAVDTEKL